MQGRTKSGRVFSIVVLAALITAAAGCAPRPQEVGRGAPLSTQDQTGPASPAAPKTLIWGTDFFPASAQEKVGAGPIGSKQRQWIFMSFLTGLDKTDTPQPILAERVPSRDDNTWIVNPDGSMDTIWKIRLTARWHDGMPITPRDFAFALQVYLDPEIPARDNAVEPNISRIDALEERTMSIKWKAPYFQANSLSGPALPPLPAHLLEDLYRADKQEFLNSRYWTTDYIGAGPFRLEEWDPVSQVVVGAAHDGFALGRPKIDRLRIVVIPDRQALPIQVLAGAVDVAMGVGGLTVQGGQFLKEQWESQGLGKVSVSPGTYRWIGFQLRDVPNARLAVRDQRIRKALAYAIDKDGIADLVPSFLFRADYPISRHDPFYPAVDRGAPKYRYDPAMAERLLDEAGLRRASDGTRRDSAGERVDMPIWARDGDSIRYGTVVADNWKQAGIDGSIVRSRSDDDEYDATFPAANLTNGQPSYTQLYWTSDHLATPANRWSGRNRGGYINPETETLYRRMLVTVDSREREGYVVELMRIWMDDVALIPIVYQAVMIAAARSVSGYDPQISPTQTGHTWNIYNWTKE